MRPTRLVNRQPQAAARSRSQRAQGVQHRLDVHALSPDDRGDLRQAQVSFGKQIVDAHWFPLVQEAPVLLRHLLPLPVPLQVPLAQFAELPAGEQFSLSLTLQVPDPLTTVQPLQVCVDTQLLLAVACEVPWHVPFRLACVLLGVAHSPFDPQ